MEIFTLAEDERSTRGGGVEPSRSHSPRGCSFRIPSSIAVSVQLVVTLILSTLLVWDIISPDVTKDIIPLFGRLILLVCLLLSFYAQSVLTAPDIPVSGRQVTAALCLYTLTILCGYSFWILEMQWSSSLSTSVANYTAIEPVILVIGSIITFYFLRRLMEAYNTSTDLEDEDDGFNIDPAGSSTSSTDGTPLLTASLLIFALLEAIFGLIFAILISFVFHMDSEFLKRVICILSLFISAVVNELAMAVCKGGRQALFSKTLGYFINLISCQFTWWLSYYKGSQLTLYGLGVGFLSLLFGVLYTLEMSLKVAQLNSNPAGPINGSYSTSNNATTGSSGGAGAGKDSSKAKKTTTFGPMPPHHHQHAAFGSGRLHQQPPPLPPEVASHCSDDDTDESSGGVESSSSKGRVIGTKCVVCVAISLQIGLGIVPTGLVVSRLMSPVTTDAQKMNEEVLSNWTTWALGFFAAILLNEIILFQDKTKYFLVSTSNGVFCLNFCLGSVLSYEAITVSRGGAYFLIVTSIWTFYFVLTHFQFVRLTRFSLKLEEGQQRRLADAKVSLFTAAAVEYMICFAAFLPATDLSYFPGKIFSLFTFPSLVFVAEVMFYYGKKRRGPFLVTFTGFFLGSVYGQVVWYVSVILDEEKVDEFLGLSKPWLFAIGAAMGVVSLVNICRFLHVITMKWGKRQ